MMTVLLIFFYFHQRQRRFDVYKTDENDMMELAKKMNNGRGISLFFHGIGNKVSIDGKFNQLHSHI